MFILGLTKLAPQKLIDWVSVFITPTCFVPFCLVSQIYGLACLFFKLYIKIISKG